MADLDTGDVLDGRFRLIDRVGSGGMGTIWRAIDEESEDICAVKVLSRRRIKSDGEGDNRLLRRFQREARVLRGLAESPYVPNYLSMGRSDTGDWYIVMEFIQGRTLRRYLQRSGGALEPKLFLLIAEQIAAAARSIHATRILHRDLCPENIMIVPDEHGTPGVRFIDFGTGRDFESDESVTGLTTIIGTPQYLAPEQTSSEMLTASTDVYAIGVIMYEMLTGQPPISVTSIGEVAKIRRATPRPLSDHEQAAAIPEELRALIMRCLDKGGAFRPTTDELLECLRDVRRRTLLGFDISARFKDWELSSTETTMDVGPAFGPVFPGAHFGPFQIHERIGVGPNSELWSASDSRTGLETALKLLRCSKNRRHDMFERGRSAAGLRHENIAATTDIDSIDGVSFVARRFVHGTSLAATLETDGPMEAARVLHVMQGLLDALEAAHDADPILAHGHLHAWNVLLDEFDNVAVTDFSIAADARDVGPGTTDAPWLAYLAPERADGNQPSTAADIFAMGGLLQAMISGQPPRVGAPLSILWQASNRPLRPAKERRGDIPEPLMDVAGNCLSRKPEFRPVSVKELRRLIEAAFA